jgi:hypothetical protein
MNHEHAAWGGLTVGARRFVLDRMAEPGEPVTLLAPVDGSGGARWLVRSERGAEFIVAAHRLSRVPAEQFYRALARRYAAS